MNVSDCETLVAADCSERPDFAVYAKTTSNKKLVRHCHHSCFMYLGIFNTSKY